MRNLKRVLSLALASVMLLGMMVIGAGAADKTAADLTDMDKVTNKEAVSLMVDLGIIVGKPDGSYAPTEGVDRATMAKLITYVLMGDVDASIFEGTKTDLTDIDTNWAEGYIKYCYSNGIITGDGQGHFFPTQGVTVVQAAKMLLVALGYEAEDRGYQNNSSWSVNIMKDAQTAGLMTNINAKATDTLTRDGAAQMIFNALFANTVTPKYAYDMGVQYVTEYTQGATLGYITYSLVKLTATVDGIINGKADISTTIPSGFQSLVDEKLPATPDMVGTQVVVYGKGTITNGAVTAVTELYSTSLSAGTTNVLGTSTDGTSIADLSNRDKKAFIAELDTGVKYIYNGTTVASISAGDVVKGSVVEFISTDDDNKAEIVKVTKKTPAKLTADPTVTTKNDKTTVTIAEIGIANKDASTVVGYEGLAKGDAVLYTTVGGVTYIEKAEKITGSVSGNNSTKGALIDGTYYLASGLGGTYTNNSINDTATYDFYLDNGGYILYAVKVAEGTATTNLAVVDQVAWVSKPGDGSLGSQNTAYMQARLVFTDGTTEIVTVASVDGVVPVAKDTAISSLGAFYDNSKTTLATAVAATVTGATAAGSDKVAARTYYVVGSTSGGAVTGRYFGVSAVADLTASTTAIITENQFYNYSVNSKGEYVLTSLKAEQGANTAINAAITGNKPTFTGSLTGNANTVFIYAAQNSDGEYTYTVYNGIANVPTTAASVNGYAIVRGSVATYVYVDLGKGSTVTESSDLVYILSNDYTAVTGETAYIYDVLLNGETTTLKLAANGYNAGELYEVGSISDKDVYTLKSTDLAASAQVGIKSVDGGVLIAGSAVYSYESGTPAYVVDGKNATTTTVDALALDGNDKVVVIETAVNSKIASVVYVTKVSLEPTAVTLDAVDSVRVAGDLKAGTAAVTGYAANTADEVKISAVTPATGTIVESISINGTKVNENAAYTLTGTGTYNVVVTVKDNTSGALSSFNYSFTVAE